MIPTSCTSKPLFTALLILLTVLTSSAAETGRLIVNIEGIKQEQGGNLVYALFDTEGSWPKHNTALKKGGIPVTATSMQIEFDSIQVGTFYALQVMHDRNTNNKLDFRWLPYPKPKEGVGVSNNHQRIGPPSYKKALFKIEDQTTTIEIQLNY